VNVQQYQYSEQYPCCSVQKQCRKGGGTRICVVVVEFLAQRMVLNGYSFIINFSRRGVPSSLGCGDDGIVNCLCGRDFLLKRKYKVEDIQFPGNLVQGLLVQGHLNVSSETG
jgi:hypothetical protein